MAQDYYQILGVKKNASEKEIRQAIARVEGGTGTVVLTDMFGGTPSNVSLTFLEKDKVEVVTGVNLPMLIRLVSFREEEQARLREVAHCASSQGKESIYLASDLLPGNESTKKT